MQGTNQSYVVTNTDTSMGAVNVAYPGRLIVHNPDSGNAVLLQHVYYGFDPTTNRTLLTLNGDDFSGLERGLTVEAP